ncbi:MAG: thioredoxin [Bacteroidales bacterium]
MRKFLCIGLFLTLGLSSVDAQLLAEPFLATASTADSKIIYLTNEQFLKQVYDYQANSKEWKYEGKLPCIVDFYADWCRPCKMLAPILEELSKTYAGRVVFYKVNVDQEKSLAQAFQINSIPNLLFVSKDGKPAMQAGLFEKTQLIQIIEEFLLGKKTAGTSEK